MIINDNLEMILLFLHKNLCCGCSLESLQRGDSNEHPQHRFEKYYLSIIIKYHQIRTLYYIPVLNKLQGIYCSMLNVRKFRPYSKHQLSVETNSLISNHRPSSNLLARIDGFEMFSLSMTLFSVKYYICSNKVTSVHGFKR